ncbi:MAG: hypothetical protein P8J37_16975 [Fuerstiella sp.]|nr:hypothetical protein [Fuerstiella sp.]
MFSGPQQGEKLPALKVTLAYGKEANQTIDLVERAAGRPSLLVIVNGSNRPAARLTRSLMNFADMHSESLFAGVAYLDNDHSAAIKQLQQAVSWWQVAPPVGISVDGAEGPGSYGLNSNVNVTVLVANKGIVIRNFAVIQPAETDAIEILRDVVSLVGGRAPGNSEVLFLSAPTHKPSTAGWHVAPQDVQLRRLICTALFARDAGAARSAAAAVEDYVGDDQKRQTALAHVAAILQERRTRVRNQPIVKHVQQWKKKYENQTPAP